MLTGDDLWRRISEYSPDDPDAHIAFSDRLRRENGWGRAYTVRVVEEYKRFLYLACAARHEVTPSEDVDAAWHLHLVHTRSYWDDLCGSVLRRPLHHGPTKGGGVERRRFGDSYEKTLSAYRRIFGTSPPSDIWPAQAERFAKTGRMRWVDTGDHWLVAKPSAGMRRLFWIGCCALGLLVATAKGAWAASGKTGDMFGVIALVVVGSVWAVQGIRWMFMTEEERARHRAKQKNGDGGCSSGGCSSSDSSGCSSGGCSSGCSGGCGGGGGGSD